MENEDLTLDFMGYKAMCHCRPIIQRLHNKRDPKIVSSEKHIDLSRPHETILDCGTLEKCYKQIFDEAVKKYNAKQKRKDRRIENYLETILNDKRQGKHKNLKADGSRKPAYEMIIQLGNRAGFCRSMHPDRTARQMGRVKGETLYRLRYRA